MHKDTHTYTYIRRVLLQFLLIKSTHIKIEFDINNYNNNDRENGHTDRCTDDHRQKKKNRVRDVIDEGSVEFLERESVGLKLKILMLGIVAETTTMTRGMGIDRQADLKIITKNNKANNTKDNKATITTTILLGLSRMIVVVEIRGIMVIVIMEIVVMVVASVVAGSVVIVLVYNCISR